MYLTSNGKNTFLGAVCNPAESYIAPGWQIFMALEMSPTLMPTIMNKWKHESKGLLARVNKGFKLAKQYFLTVHVSNQPVGELKTLAKYSPRTPGTPKLVPVSFWQDL